MFNRIAFLVRSWHRWLTLALGLQVLLWCVGGLVMTAIPIETIHGDHLISPKATIRPRLKPADFPRLAHFSAKDVLSIEPLYLLDAPVYRIQTTHETYLLDAQSGQRLPLLNRDQAQQRARELFKGDAAILSVDWLTQAPAEARRPVPLWRIRFDDRFASTFYLSPVDGRLLARRSDLWRFFDFFWMLHIMDYAERSDVNNWLLRLAASFGLGIALSGGYLLINHYRRRSAA